jgi:MFS family permease
MPAAPAPAQRGPAALPGDFKRFWVGQTISNLGTSVTLLAFPLIVFKLTGSALNLGLTVAVTTLPYLLFGLLIGAWVDRSNRKRVMIVSDLLRAGIVATIPLLAWFGDLRVWWVYAVGFLNSTLTICFDSCEFAAIPSLLHGAGGQPNADALIAANGRIQASYSAAMVIGPLLGGALVAIISVESVVLIDALSFVVSAGSLCLVRRSFNTADVVRAATSLRADIAEGLRYVFRHPVLRAISLMMLLVNAISVTIPAQLVLYADHQLGAGESRVGVIYAAGSVGVIALSLVAARLRRRWSFSQVTLGSLMFMGVLIVALALTTTFWLALAIIALENGLGTLFNINTGSLRQSIVPNAMLGRVISVAAVLASAASPVGALAGGVAVQRSGNVALVYGVVGVLIIAIAFAFTFTALGHADRYVSSDVAVAQVAA